jgi:hypothetical protein
MMKTCYRPASNATAIRFFIAEDGTPKGAFRFGPRR